MANIPILNQIVPHTDFVAQCQSALSSRRSWTIPVTAIGAIAWPQRFSCEVADQPHQAVSDARRGAYCVRP